MARSRLQILTLATTFLAVGIGLAPVPATAAQNYSTASFSGSSVEAAWQDYLAGLGGTLKEVRAEQNRSVADAVDIPTVLTASVNPLARLGGLGMLLALLLVGLLLHPETASQLRRRVGKAIGGLFPTAQLKLETIHRINGRQRMMSVEVEGARMLVGVSRGRVDLLHVWDGAENCAAAAELLGEPCAPAPRAETIELPIVEPPVDLPVWCSDGVPSPEGSDPGTLSILDEVDPGAVLFASKEASAVVETVLEDSDLCVDSVTPGWASLSEVPTLELDEEPADSSSARAEDSSLDRTLARVEAVGQEIDEILTARTRALCPAPGKRGFRRSASAGKAAVYRNRRWLGPGRAAVNLLLVLAPLLLGVILPALLGFDLAMAGEASDAALKLELGGEAAEGSATAIKLLVILTLIAMAPAIVLSMTSFTRMVVVFSLLRQALGVQQAPPNQILVGLALFLTWFVMAPVFSEVNEVAVQPYQAGTVNEADAVAAAMVPMKKFMMRNTRETDLGLFMRLSKAERPETREDVSAQVLIPAFIISELKTAFQIGFLIYIPFLIIDIVVSVVLLAMGMMVLPPVVISLPFKLLLFVFVDGWNLLVGTMVESFV